MPGRQFPPPEGVEALRSGVSEGKPPELLWAGKVRRFARVAARTLREVDTPVKICTAVLVAVIVLSTLVFHLSMHYDNVPDALYRTVSLMATAADMKGRELEPGGWQKVFVSALRAIPRYQDHGRPFSCWLYRIAANAVSSYYRLEQARAEVTEEVPDATA